MDKVDKVGKVRGYRLDSGVLSFGQDGNSMLVHFGNWRLSHFDAGEKLEVERCMMHDTKYMEVTRLRALQSGSPACLESTHNLWLSQLVRVINFISSSFE